MSYLGLIGLPEQCTQAFGDIFNKECGMILVSKLLGLAMIAGSVLLKVPQIQNIVSSGSVEGLAPMSFYSEVCLPYLNSFNKVKQNSVVLNEDSLRDKIVVVLVHELNAEVYLPNFL